MRRRALVGLALVVALAGCVTGCGGTGQSVAAPAAGAKGDAELAAITVPADWTLTSSKFEPSGLNDPNNHWVRWYDSPARGTDALRAYDSSVLTAGWKQDTSCPLSTGHGCWTKPGYTLVASAGEGSGCQPGAKICAVIEVRLSDR